jgi:hypothetical protein
MPEFRRKWYRHPALACLKLFIIGAVAFLATARLLGIFLLPPLTAYDQLQAKTDISLRYPDTNLIFIGPSYVYEGMNPEIFDQEMSVKGVETHSFNLGLDGLSVVEMRSVLEHLLDKKPCCIKYVIMSPCYECLNVALNLDSARSIEFFDWRHSLDFVKYVFDYDVLPVDKLTKLELVGNVASSFFRHYTNVGLIWNALNLADPAPNFLSFAFWEKRAPRGYHVGFTHIMDWKQTHEYEDKVGNYPQLRTEFIRDLERNPRAAGMPDFVSEAMFEVLVEQVRFLSDKGIAVMVVIPPNLWMWTYHAAFLTRLRAQCGDDIAFVDFGDAEKWPELFLPADIRSDSAHMNAKGAAVWSKLLADQFAKAIAMQTLLQGSRPICNTAPRSAAGAS